MTDTIDMNRTLEEQDPEIADLVEREKNRQWKGLELIASENITSRAVMEALGSCFTNKYSEGLPFARYYGGNEVVDEMETLCIKRALTAFRLDEDKWGVNVQCYSGSTANFSAYTGLIQPHDRIMGLDLPSGGHLTHGFYTAKKKISASSVYFESLPYKVSQETGLIDYDKLEEQAILFRPKLLLCGGSAYPREWDYARLRAIADACGALLFCDMAHISGLVAGNACASPFDYADIVTSTTHKTLRGPRSGLIFFRKGEGLDFEERINTAVFPMTQGGPHENTIAALAVQLKEAATPEFADYIQQVIKNSQAMAAELIALGHKVVTDGTDNHLLLWDLRPKGVTGSKMEKILDKVHITVNKNTIIGDKSALSPSGVRLGSNALTTRRMKEAEMKTVVGFLDRACNIAVKIQETVGKKLVDFEKAIQDNADLDALKADVQAMAKQHYMPGWDLAAMKYQE